MEGKLFYPFCWPFHWKLYPFVNKIFLQIVCMNCTDICHSLAPKVWIIVTNKITSKSWDTFRNVVYEWVVVLQTIWLRNSFWRFCPKFGRMATNEKSVNKTSASAHKTRDAKKWIQCLHRFWFSPLFADNCNKFWNLLSFLTLFCLKFI